MCRREEPLLAQYLQSAQHVITFGPGGDVQFRRSDVGQPVEIDLAGRVIELEVPFSQAHLRANLLAAVAAASVVGVIPRGRVEVAFSPGRGQRIELPDGITVIDDCYNANPMSMRAALDDLVATAPPGGSARRVAVLGDMLELGPDERTFHVEAGRHADEIGIDLLMTVGRLAGAMGEAFNGESYRAATAADGCAPGARAGQAGRRRAGQRLARGGARGGVLRPDREPGLMGPLAVVAGSISGRVLIAGTASLLMCVFLSPKFIEFLRRREFGQNIREEGPQGHLRKAGTPTMGGIIIFLAIAVPFLVLSHRDWQAIGVFGAAIACALLGFVDDFMKIVKRRSLGLRARTKLLLTAVIAVGLWWVATQKVGLAPTVRLRFVDVTIDLGPFYPVFIFLVLAGSTTAVNFTDGLDGLAAGCCAIVLMAYVAITFISGNRGDLTMVAACLVGGCIGFLWFNSFPASVFMGDTGSLGLGGAIAGLAVMTKTEVLLILIGGVFVVEVLSVVAQVISFQTMRKRIFLMAPIHHHFELKGWSETKIILRLWIMAASCAAIGFVVYQLSIRG